MNTAQDLIKLSLKLIGVLGSGQTPREEQLNDALTIMNMMIGQWNRKRWLIPHLVESTKAATGAISYSVGTGADFNVPYPDRIEDAFVRLHNGGPGSDFNADFNAAFGGNGPPIASLLTQYVDYPISMLEAREDYNRISLKAMGAFPYVGFYDSAYPIGQIYFWPVPSILYEMHIFVKDTLKGFPQLNSSIILSPEYVEALYYNLAARLAPTYGVEPKPIVVALAAASLNTLRGANTQVPQLKLPGLLTRNNRSSTLPTFVGKAGI